MSFPFYDSSLIRRVFSLTLFLGTTVTIENNQFTVKNETVISMYCRVNMTHTMRVNTLAFYPKSDMGSFPTIQFYGFHRNLKSHCVFHKKNTISKTTYSTSIRHSFPSFNEYENFTQKFIVDNYLRGQPSDQV